VTCWSSRRFPARCRGGKGGVADHGNAAWLHGSQGRACGTRRRGRGPQRCGLLGGGELATRSGRSRRARGPARRVDSGPTITPSAPWPTTSRSGMRRLVNRLGRTVCSTSCHCRAGLDDILASARSSSSRSSRADLILLERPPPPRHHLCIASGLLDAVSVGPSTPRPRTSWRCCRPVAHPGRAGHPAGGDPVNELSIRLRLEGRVGSASGGGRGLVVCPRRGSRARPGELGARSTATRY